MVRGTGAYRIEWGNWKRWQRTTMLRHIEGATAEVVVVAKANASVHRYPDATGHLAESIYARTYPTTNGFVSRVGSDLPYAASVEKGAKPHIIRPRPTSLGSGVYRTGVPGHGRPGRYLRFHWWNRGGILVYTRMVLHPGQRGNHYLRDAIIVVGNRRRMRIIVY